MGKSKKISKLQIFSMDKNVLISFLHPSKSVAHEKTEIILAEGKARHADLSMRLK